MSSAGEVVLRLDDTITRANLAIVTKGLDEMVARAARLIAERDGAEEVAFPAELLARINDPDVAAIVEANASCSSCAATRALGQKSQLKERIAQLAEEIAGTPCAGGPRQREIELIQRELEGVCAGCGTRTWCQINRLISLEREAARLKGERASRSRRSARSRGKIGEIELQIIQIDQDLSSEVGKELREIRWQDRRIRRKQGGSRGPAQARRHPRAAGRRRASAGRAHGRRRGQARARRSC